MHKTILTTAFWAILLSGCRVVEERIIYDAAPAPSQAAVSTPAAQAQAEVIERRFTDSQEQMDAVQSAVAWAKKYEQVMEKNAELQEKHNQLFLQNSQLTAKLEQTQAELERTRKELTEANEFLQQMHAELNKWKADVLGYREEMRQAQAAQLEALGRILQVLGAEPVKTPAP